MIHDLRVKLLPDLFEVISCTLSYLYQNALFSGDYCQDKCRLPQDFSGLIHTSDLKTGTPVATLPGAWRYRVSAGTDRPSISILWLGEEESLICNFYLSVAACKIVCADLSLRYTRMLLGR